MMAAGPDQLSFIERKSRWVLNWSHDGRGGLKQPWENNEWRVTLHRPHLLLWAKAQAWNKKPEQTLTHAVKYSVHATHKPTQQKFQKFVWRCGGHTYSEGQIIDSPEEVCAKCYHQVMGKGQGSVRLASPDAREDDVNHDQ